MALRTDMKEWRLNAITIRRLQPPPGEWVYVVYFSAVPKSAVWNGPVPTLEIPVGFDGTVPEPMPPDSK